jgi:hypothetical protein
MKIQIIQLEAHDDVTTTRDRLSWAKTARVLLVFPARARILTRPLDLVVLQRYCQSMGGQLGLVVRDPSVRANAAGLGIPVFFTVRQARRLRWKHGRARTRILRRNPPPADLRGARDALLLPEPAWLRNPWARLGVFTLGLLAVLALVAFFYPSAQIELEPKQETQRASLPVTASPRTRAVNLSGSIPARTLSLVVAGQSSLAATGNTRVPEKRASGKVTFRNLTGGVVTVPAGTILRGGEANASRYLVTQAGDVPAGGSTDLRVEALALGEQANLPAASQLALEGELGLSLAASNPEAISGGSSKLTPAVSPQDYSRLVQQLVDELREQALAMARAQAQAGDILVEDSLRMINTLEQVAQPEVGQPADRLTMSLRLEYTMDLVSGADLYALAGQALDATLPDGYAALAGTLAITPAGAPVYSEGSSQLRIVAERAIQPQVAAERVTLAVTGKKPDEALRWLESALPLQDTPVIRMQPAWW